MEHNKTDLEYERDLCIDESALDVEWINQPTLMFKYSRELAKAEKEVSRLKEKISVERARLDKDIRSNPVKYKVGDIKITEAVVSNAIVTNKDFQELTKDLIEAQYEVNMVKGAVDAVKQRKDALQDLVRLHGQQYFAGPTVPRDLSAEVKQHLKDNHKKAEKEVSNSSIKIRRKK
jgi:hypothetical protein